MKVNAQNHDCTDVVREVLRRVDHLLSLGFALYLYKCLVELDVLQIRERTNHQNKNLYSKFKIPVLGLKPIYLVGPVRVNVFEHVEPLILKSLSNAQEYHTDHV